LPRTLIVRRGSEYETIQSAINAAERRDTIQVYAGIYTEQLVINKDLTLTGMIENISRTIITAPAMLMEDWQKRKDIVEIGANNPPVPPRVDMSRFTVSGPAGVPDAGIGVYGGAYLELSHVDVTDIRTPSTSGFEQSGGIGIAIGRRDNTRFPGGQIGGATITDVNVTNYGEHGILVIRDGSRAQISGSRVRGHGSAQQAGIMVAQKATAIVGPHNVVSSTICNMDYCGNDPLNQGQSVGIGTSDAGTGTHIINNTTVNNDVGIYLYYTPSCTTTNNTLTDNRFYGLVIHNGNAESASDTISGGEYGVAVAADERDTSSTIRNATITGYSPGREIREMPVSPYTVTVLRS
jgi:parallel beta-helix repeat protein